VYVKLADVNSGCSETCAAVCTDVTGGGSSTISMASMGAALAAAAAAAAAGVATAAADPADVLSSVRATLLGRGESFCSLMEGGGRRLMQGQRRRR